MLSNINFIIIITVTLTGDESVGIVVSARFFFFVVVFLTGELGCLGLKGILSCTVFWTLVRA